MTKVEIINKLVELEPSFKEIRGRLFSAKIEKLKRLLEREERKRRKENNDRN